MQSTTPRTTLNVEVEEFHPRNYTPAVQPKSTTDTSTDSKDTKQTSPEPQKVTILHRNSTGKTLTQSTMPNKMGKDKPEKVNVQISSAIDKSSTLISSISSRDKNDDNVNGVDNNKKIEKLVDPVNVKADLDDKVVMHPKQQENILENVKKTKFKNIKPSKSSPRKTNVAPSKKDVKIGRGVITNGKVEQMRTAVPKDDQSIESKPKENGVEKPSQPTYAQMVGPVPKPRANDVKPDTVHVVPGNVVPLPVEESTMFDAIEEVKPAVKIETKWQTVRPKGKKKIFSVMCDEPDDQWNDFDEEKPIEVDETKKVTPPTSEQIVIDEQIVTNDVSMDATTTPTTTPAKVKPPKTEKSKLKLKAKKSQKKIKEKIVKSNGISDGEATIPNGTSTPKIDKPKSKSVTPIIDELFVNEGKEFLNDIDISNFNFEPNPSMFVNAITNSGIFTDNSLTGKSKAGLALNNSLKLLNAFDFCKTKENVLLKEEEEMVIRVMKSLNQTDNRIVKNDAYRCINVDDDVKLNVEKVEKNIFDGVNGHNDTHDDDDVDDKKDDEIIGAELLNVKCEVNGNGDEMNEKDNTTEPESMLTNGHKIEDAILTNGQLDEVDQNGMATDSKIESITNGNQLITELKLNNGPEIDVINVHAQTESCEMDAFVEDDKNEDDVTNVADKIETETIDAIEESDGINKDCTTNIKYDDEAHSDLSELSDENDETIVSQSNDCFEYDEIETIKEVDVTELIDDLQFDDEFVLGSDEDVNVDKTNDNEIKPQDDITMMPEISMEDEAVPQNIFIENESDIAKTEITLNDIEESKGQDRIQSPRNSEDSGILESSQDDGRYFSESDTDKTEQISIKNFPLTDAVSRWLEEKQKEKSPEPIIRLPNDPELSQRIEKSLLNRVHISQIFDDYEDDESSDESETEYETGSKNLISNPLRVLFRKNETTITTSNHSSNGIRKRVASRKLDSDRSSMAAADEPDILEYWENDPMLQNSNSNVLNNDEENCCSIDTDLEAYESVYGKTIDYANLSANIHNDDVFLSNNILNTDKLSNLPIKPINNNADSSLSPQACSINGKNEKNLNCFKPPEICCMLM